MYSLLIRTEFHSNVVICVKDQAYLFGSMILNITHVRSKRDVMGTTVKLGRCVCVSYLLMCAKFHGSVTNSRRKNPFGWIEGSSHLIIF